MNESTRRLRPRIYLITPPVFALEEMASRLAQALAGGDVACVQLRMKGADDAAILAAAARLMPIAHAHDAAFLVNDRADLAKKAGADGVHLGQGDGDIRAARELLGHERDIGVTCHDSRHLAFEAGEEGADYVAFGAFYPSTTKEAPTRADPHILTLWSEISELPSVAIGGIRADNCAELVRAGADFLAVSSYVWDHPDGPGAAVAALDRAIDEAFEDGQRR
ncbi:MAG: thiamine phosphate synthase [Rhodothalassiaceae bacterium]